MEFAAFYLHIFFFILGFKHDFIRCIDFTRIAASNKQVMSSQIRLHMEYLVQSYHIFVLIF